MRVRKRENRVYKMHLSNGTELGVASRHNANMPLGVPCQNTSTATWREAGPERKRAGFKWVVAT